MTLSLWQDLESAFAFTYFGQHGRALGKAHEWFVETDLPSYVLWWEQDNHTPTWQLACDKLEQLGKTGPSSQTFNFRKCFDPTGKATQVDCTLARQYALEAETTSP